VAQDKALGVSLGVNSTPTFFIAGSWIVGDQPFSEFQKAIEASH
jgi:protein-disulfide isomerase